MSAAKDLLKALECLHNAKIVHHGKLTPICCSLISVHAKYPTDLNKENVMWGICSLDNLSEKKKYECLGRPKKVALTDLWKQGELVTPVEVPELFLCPDTAYLGDFGMAAKAGTDIRLKKFKPSPWNVLYHAPETFHNDIPSFASDMWSYMCLFADLYLGFNPWGPGSSHVKIITRMVRILGPLPRHWKDNYTGFGERNDSWYDQRRKRDRKVILESIIKKERPEVGSVERGHVVEIMSKGFCYSPDGRPTATKLLQDSSFQAIMEIYVISCDGTFFITSILCPLLTCVSSDVRR
jgi:serine/threonine protein kinase